MRILEGIFSQTILAIDIETVRYKENFDDLSEDWKSAWEYKNKQDGVVPTSEELSVLWKKNASLYPEFSKVVAISLVYLNKGQLKCKSYAGENEKGILEAFAVDITMFAATTKGYRLAAHAGKFFDFPFLCKRYIANFLPIPSMLDESGVKPWDASNLCTNELWRSFGQGSGSSLQALCTLLNIPISKVDLVGDEVGNAYFRGELLRIAEYCNLDAIAEFNLFLRFKGEPIFTFEEVIYVNKGELIKKDSIFEALAKNPVITPEIHHEICETANTMTQKERTSYSKLLRAALNKTEEQLSSSEKALFSVLAGKKARTSKPKE